MQPKRAEDNCHRDPAREAGCLREEWTVPRLAVWNAIAPRAWKAPGARATLTATVTAAVAMREAFARADTPAAAPEAVAAASEAAVVALEVAVAGANRSSKHGLSRPAVPETHGG